MSGEKNADMKVHGQTMSQERAEESLNAIKGTPSGAGPPADGISFTVTPGRVFAFPGP